MLIKTFAMVIFVCTGLSCRISSAHESVLSGFRTFETFHILFRISFKRILPKFFRGNFLHIAFTTILDLYREVSFISIGHWSFGSFGCKEVLGFFGYFETLGMGHGWRFPVGVLWVLSKIYYWSSRLIIYMVFIT